MEEIQLKAIRRHKVGKGTARKLRVEGLLPAVAYGPGAETILLSISPSEIERCLKSSRGYNIVISMSINDNGGEIAKRMMIKEIQVHPVTRKPLHVDFYEVAENRPVKVRVPILLQGKSVGVQLGGILQQILREIDIECLPHRIPESIVVDITNLNAGTAFHISDLTMEEGVKAIQDGQLTILTISGLEEETKEAEGKAE